MTLRLADLPEGARVALYAGSFNPFTLGHLSVASRAAGIFDFLVVAIGVNASKGEGSAAEAASRLAQVNDALDKLPEPLRGRCAAMTFSGELTVDLAARIGARWLVRGARGAAEFEAETAMADVNRRLSGIETVILPALPSLACCSSSIVRELRSYGRDVSEFLP